jgi:KDO2-lipid IV(A) lauroyltransferase
MAGKSLAGRASFQLVRFLLFITKIIPVKASYLLCSFLASTAALFNWERKRIALGNLEIVFPEKSERERKHIFRVSLINMLRNYFEICFVANGKYSADDILRSATAFGLENLDELKRSGKGALLYSGHFGNFPLMVLWLALKGYPIAAIYKEAANFPDDFFGDIMKRFNVIPIKYKNNASLTVGIIRALKEGKFILIQNDQSHPSGVYINFFDRSVPAPAGPTILAKRVGVPVIPTYIFRDTQNHHFINILPEIPLREAAEQEKFITLNTQIQLDWIASILRSFPTEWLWLHNRWKRAR